MNLDDWIEWIKLVTRWVHVFAAILWIGQTYLFNFFEKSLEPSQRKNIVGNLWMVHGGGFYLLEKQKIPEIMPQTLHWFKWEAAVTWLSGVVLIGLTYYWGGLLVEPGMSHGVAAGVGVGVIVVGWVVYDSLVGSPLGKNEPLFAIVMFALILSAAYLLISTQSSRSAFLHVGALFGTIMAANVWMRILPSQSKMIALAKQGVPPDPSLSATGPLRSKHNSYMVVPLVFLMISNHYPTVAYGNPHNLVVLALLILVGWGFAKIMRG